MTVRKRSILPRLLIFIVLLVCAAWIWQNYFAYDGNGRPPDRYRGDIPTITGTSDADGDGIPDQQDILQGALDYVATRAALQECVFRWRLADRRHRRLHRRCRLWHARGRT